MTEDEFNWRKVKDADGLYVHTVDAHEYPGWAYWDPDHCAIRDHPSCERSEEAP